MSLLNKVKTYSDEAPVSGFINTNFGKLTVTPIVVSWEGPQDNRTVKKFPLTEGYELKEQEQLELKMVVNISELNPALTFEYERSVPIKSNGTTKTDWAEIVLPSFEKIFGKNSWADAIEAGPYVSVDDVPNIAGRSNPNNGKVYGIPRFTAKFANLEECKAAQAKRYPKRGDAAEEVNPDQPSDKIVKDAKALVKSLGEAGARKQFEAKALGNYDPDVLMALALN